MKKRNCNQISAFGIFYREVACLNEQLSKIDREREFKLQTLMKVLVHCEWLRSAEEVVLQCKIWWDNVYSKLIRIHWNLGKWGFPSGTQFWRSRRTSHCIFGTSGFYQFWQTMCQENEDLSCYAPNSLPCQRIQQNGATNNRANKQLQINGSWLKSFYERNWWTPSANCC